MNDAREDSPTREQRNNSTESAQGDSLADAVRDEREVPRTRLREQLKREPTEEEIDEYLREHTEGY